MSQLYDTKDLFEDDWSYEDPISNEEINQQIFKGRAMPSLDDLDLT